jgi:pimeloyl-ACP methyl ester carboxylesterase
MYKILTALSFSTLLLSCNNNANTASPNDKDTDHTLNKTIIDTPAIAGKKVKGFAGFVYVDDGGTGGIPVVFAHSFGGNTTHWKHQLEHLRSSRRAIAFDFRGHGRSDLPSARDSYSADALAKDIEVVADELGLQRFVLVGHSMGGAAAIAYASTHPNKVAGLVLAGTPGKTPPQQAHQVMSSLESDAYQQVMDNYMKQLLTNARPGVDTMVENGFRKIALDPSISIIKAMFDYDPVAPLKNYKGPVLIISTDRESQQPSTLAKQAKGIPNKIIAGTSHWMQLDKPDEFNTVLDGFLKNVEQ